MLLVNVVRLKQTLGCIAVGNVKLVRQTLVWSVLKEKLGPQKSLNAVSLLLQPHIHHYN